jgi:uncharacterized NAD(P)/FAD-binding protein YdhS
VVVSSHNEADIIIIGAGFSGGLILANLIQKLNKPTKIIIADDSKYSFKGTAYSTNKMEHLLNVRAKGMGAFKDDITHFHDWLTKRGYKYNEDDFVPRKIYGEYLEFIKQISFEEAGAKDIEIKFIESSAVKAETKNNKNIIHFENGSVASAKFLVLATGNQIGQNKGAAQARPWQFDYSVLDGDGTNKPIVIIGTGLTAVDTILSIARSNFPGKIFCISRNALFPKSHTKPGEDKKFDMSPYANKLIGSSPSKIFRQLIEISEKEKNYLWQSIMDSLRPYTQSIWKGFSTSQQKLVLGKYLTVWNIHRHRMAPEIHDEIFSHINSGKLKLIAAECKGYENNIVTYKDRAGEHKIEALYIFDCRGPSYRKLPDIFNSLISEVTPSDNGYGVKCDENFFINKNKATPIFAIGNPLVGELFETTAVPELRVEADSIAKTITNML